MNATLKKQAQQAIKNICSGELNNRDLLAIVRLQVPKLPHDNDVAAAFMVLTQQAFN
jgi:hypothetical protein